MMSSNLTQFSQKKLLDHTLALASYSVPTTHLALFTSNPGEGGSIAGEVTGGSYARVALAGKLTATVLGTGLCVNGSAITFPSPSAAWGAVTHIGVCDASSAGNVLLYLPLQSAIIVGSGNPAPNFAINALQITSLFSDTSQLTKYLAKKWLDHVLGIASFTAPAGVYLGMFSSDPTSDGTLTGEITSGGYARRGITSVMDAAVLATGIAANNAEIAFPNPTAAYSVTHFAVLDALTSGNMLWRKARSSTLNVRNGGAPVRIAAGQLALAAA
jgi:hypothetical protein